MVALTIGMPTYNDFDGVYMTVQALRLYQNLEGVELLVVDNYGCDDTRSFVEWDAGGRYVLANEVVGTAAAKNRVFAEARGDTVLCCDSHVLFAPGVIARLRSYFRAHRDCRDLLQGPMLSDNFQTVSTHQEPVWEGMKWGRWATDPRGLDPSGAPFEIWGQGMGAFSCRKAAWLGFNQDFRGFGGEEGYIHEKYRQRGARCLCLPWLRWGHRFGRGSGAPYPLLLRDLVRNYVVGHLELGLDLGPVIAHYSEHMPAAQLAAIVDEVMASGQTPFFTPHSAPSVVTTRSPAVAKAERRPMRRRSSSGKRR